jgi:phage shock protein A
MGLLDRTSDLVNRRVDRLLDELDDSTEGMDYTYERLKSELKRVDESIAELVTERKRLEERRTDLEARIEQRNDQARQAVEVDREDLARRALELKQEDMRRLHDVEDRIEELRGAETELKGRRDELEERVERFRSEQTERIARQTAERAEANVSEALSGEPEADSTETGRRVGDATDEIEESEARAAAMEELRERGVFDDGDDVDEIDEELARERRDDEVESELDTIRRQVLGDEPGDRVSDDQDDDAASDDPDGANHDGTS